MDALTEGGELYIHTYAEAVALCGGPPSPAQHRMILRGNDRAARAMSEQGKKEKRRLAALDGAHCPLCRKLLGDLCRVEFIGYTLLCPNGHAWSNADAAESEIREVL